jgi:hypothetical protein
MRPWPSITYQWGSTTAERAGEFACDTLLEEPDDTLFRAIDVAAPAASLFRWLCQLRAAPYSYDRLDNGGRQSPRTLTPGLEELAVGQRVMRIFRLVHYEPGRSITILCRGRLMGAVACTYEVRPVAEQRCRLVVKMLLEYRGAPAPLMRLVMPPGDLVMIRRQMLNLKELAEAGSGPAG